MRPVVLLFAAALSGCVTHTAQMLRERAPDATFQTAANYQLVHQRLMSRAAACGFIPTGQIYSDLGESQIDIRSNYGPNDVATDIRLRAMENGSTGGEVWSAGMIHSADPKAIAGWAADPQAPCTL